MDHLDLAGVLTTPPQWNLPAFELQDAVYLSSSRQMLEPIMEETSEDEDYGVNSWQQCDHKGSDAECGATTESESVCGGTGGAGGASFWSSAESDTGSVIRIEINKDNDSTSERDFLCPAKRARRCEESLATGLTEDEVVLRRPLYADLKNNSLERFLNYENFSRDSWGANSQQRSSVGSRRGFDDFYSDSDSLSYNSLSRSSSLLQFESLERQLLIQEQHASMNSLGNSSPSLISFEPNEETAGKATSNSGNNSANNSRRGSQSSLLKKYESLDGRLHQTYYDLDKLNLDDMNNGDRDNFSKASNLKISSHMAELRSDSESSSEGSEGSSRQQSVLLSSDCHDNDILMKQINRTNSQQIKKGKSSAENLSEDSGYCEPSMGFGLRRSKSQSLLKNYEKFSEEEEEMENKSLTHNNQQQTFIELKVEQQTNNKHSIIHEFKNITTRQETTKSPPLSPHLEFIRHKQRTEAHSPSPVSSEVSTLSSHSSHSTTSNNSNTSSPSSSVSSTSSASTCASKASFTWLMPSAAAATAITRQSSSSRDLAVEENPSSEISINDLRELQTSNEENVQIFSGKFKNNIEDFSSLSPSSRRVKYVEKQNECLECRNILKAFELNECRNCALNVYSISILKQENLCCQKCKKKFKCEEKILNNADIPEENRKSIINCESCGKQIFVDLKLATKLNEQVRTKIIEQQLQLLTDKRSEFVDTEIIKRNCLIDYFLDYKSAVSTPESLRVEKSCGNSPTTSKQNFNSSCSSTPETSRRSLKTIAKTYACSASSDSDYSPLRLRKNIHSLMLSWPVKTSSVPNELNTIGRKKKLRKAKTCSSSGKPISKTNNSEPLTDNDSVSSNGELNFDSINIKRSLSWSFQKDLELKAPSLCVEPKNLGLLHQSYHNLALLNLDIEEENCLAVKMAEKRISSDYETELVCKNNFLLDEISAHFDRTASILNDKPIDQIDSGIQPPIPPQRDHNRKPSISSCTATENCEAEEVQHVALVIRKPPARQKRNNCDEKVNSLTQDYSLASIMQSSDKTFDQDPTILKTSYAQSLEKCNFDCRELSNQDFSNARALPKRRFHSQANISKKTKLVSSTPNLNAYDFNHQDDIEDDMFVSSAHTSMHQLPLSQTQKPLGILLPTGSRTSFGKEVSFCPVVSKYCWQEQSSEECNDGHDGHHEGDDESEDELLDNADATVIYNTKENENIASKYSEEFLKREQQENIYQEKCNDDKVIKEKVVLKEINTKQQVENVMLSKECTETDGNETQQREEASKSTISTQDNNEQAEHKERTELITIATQSSNDTPVTTVSLTTNVNNDTLIVRTDDNITEQKRVNNYTNTSTSSPTTEPTVVVARPLSIQLPILSEPPINRAHHILYASQQMLDNFQRQKQNEEYEHFKSQSTQNLSKMSGRTADLQQQQPTTNTKLNNNNEIMKSKFKHEEKHPNSKGFLSRFANGFRFSLRRNKKKLQQKEIQPNQSEMHEQNNTNGQINQNRSNSLPAAHKQADFIHIPLKGPLPENRNGNTKTQINGNSSNSGNAKNVTMLLKQKGAKTKDTNDKQQKVTGKPPIPPQQQQQVQQLQKVQSAQSSQLQQQPLVEVGLSRFYTETESNNPTAAAAPHVHSVMQDFLTSERGLYNENYNQQHFTTIQSCANNQLLRSEENDTKMTAVNTNNTATYEFTSPSRATVSQKTQMFNNLSRKSEQPKIGLIETNLDTHETIITGKTRSLINIGPNQHQRYAGNKRLHTTTNSHNHHQEQYNRHHLDGNEADDDVYDDNDDDEVVVRPDGSVVVIKNTGSNGTSSSPAAQIVSVRRPHKSMEFLLDKENQKDVMTTSEDSQTELQAKPLRKKKLRRYLSLRKENSLDEPNKIFSTDSDSDCKSEKAKIKCCTLPKSKKCSNYVKKLIFKTLHAKQPCPAKTELSKFELDKSLIRQVNSPSKIKTAYTLTAMSSPSPHSESDGYDADLPATPIKNASKSWPSLLAACLEDDATNLLKYNYNYVSKDLTKLNGQQDQQKLLMDSLIDQGFETASNYTESPLRLPRKAGNAERENFENIYTAQPARVLETSPTPSKGWPRSPLALTPLTSIKEDFNTESSEEGLHTPSTLNTSSKFFSQDLLYYYPSQFWIKSGDFIAAITINHYDVHSLQLLRHIYVENSLECMEMNFGIDDQVFCANKTTTNDMILKEVPKENNYSFYWFSTGDFVIPFRGKPITTKKIQSFFNYIRECMEETGCIKFGVDNCEFSNIYQQTQNSIQAISPLKTSDLEQSDFDLEEYQQKRALSALSKYVDDAVAYDNNDFISHQLQLSAARNLHVSKC